MMGNSPSCDKDVHKENEDVCVGEPTNESLSNETRFVNRAAWNK